ncbi:MAG: cytochrome P450 [Alphaproteobacteria bacterium]|nr:cytochrome P450 [Alphaproteobacteria bacterium]
MSSTDPVAPDAIDLYDPETQEDWFPAYRRLHEQSPVYRIPGTDTYVVCKYEDVLAVVRDPETFSNQPEIHGGEQLIEHAEARQYYVDHGLGRETGRARWPLLGMDPPDHKKYRVLIDKDMLSKTALRRAQPMIERTVDELIDGFAGAGGIEFIRDFGVPLPIRIITLLIGFPLEDIPQLKEWSTTWTLPFARGLTLEQELEVARQGVAFQDYIRRTADARRKEPRDDVITHLVQARYEGERPLTDHEIASIVDNMYVGGNETTTFTLASGLWLMLRDPSVYRALRDDPGKIPNFVEEVLRFESPTQGLDRIATRDTEIRGVPIPKGSTVHIRFGAGNRDGEVFACPDALDIDRENAGKHLAFSQGEHHCPGGPLARMELVIAYQRLLARLPNLRLTPGRNDFRHHPGFVLRGLKELWLSFDAG